MCVNAIPTDFCNYSLTNLRAFMTNEKFNGRIEMTMTNEVDGSKYECFDGLYT